LNTISHLEFEQLLDRLAEILPVARQNEHDRYRAAKMVYFTAQGEPEEAAETGTLPGDFVHIDTLRTVSPEERELHSIGLAVAAFGGANAITDIGYALTDRGCKYAQFLWGAWNGMGGLHL